MKPIFLMLLAFLWSGCESRNVPGSLGESKEPRVERGNKAPFVVIHDRSVFFSESAGQILTPRSTLPLGTIVYLNDRQGVWADIKLPSGVNGTVLLERLREAQNTDIRAFNARLADNANRSQPREMESMPLPPDLPMKGGTRAELEALLLPPIN